MTSEPQYVVLASHKRSAFPRTKKGSLTSIRKPKQKFNMPSTRSSDKKTGLDEQAAGSKHEIDEKTSSVSKRTKTNDTKEQKTIEESFG